MNVLVTGGLGNVGRNCLAELQRQGHEVTCFDVRSRPNERAAKKVPAPVRILWGDIRDQEGISIAVRSQDIVVHLAFILPPDSEKRPDVAREINVDGTWKLIVAIRKSRPPPKMIFISSFSVFGDCQHKPPPRTVADPVQPMDHYNRHKVECETLIKESGLDWLILRLAVVPPLTLGGFNPKMFDIPPGTRIEFVHPRDVALAVANAAISAEVWGKILLIGGGEGAKLYYRDFVGRMTESMGVGRLPDAAFASSASAFCDWIDTTESQRLLNYQQHTFNDFVQEVAATLGYRRYLVQLVAPLVRRWMLSQSPHYRLKDQGEAV
jgi:UDP-glucose 4-epimerase